MFVPSILPIEALLAPISADQPTGVDLRLVGDEIDEIIKAGRTEKDVNLGDWVTKEGPKVADWSKVKALSIDVLSHKSKDLVVAVRLHEALIVRHGLAGLHEGLWLLRELLERYWDGLHPGLEDGDVEYRVQPFTWLNDQVAWRIGELQRPEEYQPFAELEAALAAATGCREEFLALYRVIEQRYGRDIPRVGAINERIEKYVDTVSDLVERMRPVETVAPSETETTAAGAGRAPRNVGDPVDRDDAVRRLLQTAAFVRKNDPESPLGYRLARVAQWADAKKWAAAAPPQSELPAPPTELRSKLAALEAEGSWSELLSQCEDAVTTPAGRFWLDLHRYVVAALENLGGSYQHCADVVKDELRRYVSDFPALPTLYLSDFTAVATPATQTWIATAILLPVSAAPAEGVAPESNGNGQVDIWREAQLRIHAGQKLEGLDMLRAEILRAPSGRDAFTWKVRLAELCIAEGMPKLAIPLLEELAEQIDYYHLDEWEPRDLSARVFSALYQCYKHESDGSGDYEARGRVSFARLCRLDVSRAFRDVNAR